MATWDRSNVTLGSTIDDLDDSIFLTVESSGSTPGKYTYEYTVWACNETSEESPRVTLTRHTERQP